MENLVKFPVESKLTQLIDSGLTKVFLVAFDPNKTGNIFLTLEGTFSGDDVTAHQALSTKDLTLDQISEVLINQDIQDQYYYPYLGTKYHHQSIPFIAVSQIGIFDKTIEYLSDIYPWTCSFHDLTKEGKEFYSKWKLYYPNLEVRILTMANI